MPSTRILTHLHKPTSTSNLIPRIRTRSTLVHPRFALPLTQPPSFTTTTRLSSTSTSAVEAPTYLDANERKIFDMIKLELQPTKLEVQDISGGCGSMYGIDIVSEKFKGLSVIKQHRLVNSVLGEEIKKWHGVQLKTKAPEE